MRVTMNDDLLEVARLIDLPPQIVAEALQWSTTADIKLKTKPSFAQAQKIFLDAPVGSKLKKKALQYLSEIANSREEWKQYQELTRTVTSGKYTRRFRSFYRWIRILKHNPGQISKIRKAWNVYRRADADSEAQRSALSRVIALL
jgi:hypothetical protein